MRYRKDYIPLEDAKKLIIAALDQFNPELAVRAAGVLYDEARLNVVEVESARTNMMQCRPAGITMEDVIAADMHIPDFSERFGPHFTRQDNPTDHAIVDFEYDGSPRSIVWLGHEAGHAIADDIQREHGHSFRDFSAGEMEEQAYFVQHVVSGYIKDNLKHHDLKDENLGQNILKMSWDRATQYTNAGIVVADAVAAPFNERKEITFRALDQRLG